jgi:alpha-galactosidase
VRELAVYGLDDMTAHYWVDDSDQVGLVLRPTSLQPVTARSGIGDEPYIATQPGAGNPPARSVDPLVHVTLRGDAATGGWAQGRTMRWSPSASRFRLADHLVEHVGLATRIVTVVRSADGLSLEHRLIHRTGESHLRVEVEFVNDSPEPVIVDALTSFNLSGISPFDPADSPERLLVHRLRSSWSAEAQPVSNAIEDLQLERSWLGIARLSERFGQVGTMPARGWFPFLAVEDKVAQVTWGAQLAWAGSWQMEIARLGDDVAISGGLADREFGHWSHTAMPGERLVAPTAILSCTQGTVDDVTDRLVAAQNEAADTQPKSERSLPIVFNEWCTSWGNPDRERLIALADRLAGEGVGYLVIDAGWYRDTSSDVSWAFAHGDWIPSPDLFPFGLKEVADRIRERGMTPGLWFEFETVGETSTAFTLTDHLLRRDGVPFTAGNRRFWDLTNPFAVDYLTSRVVDRLEQDGFGYLKVDYNEHLGLGTDHTDGLGEGLRRQVLAGYRFLDGICTRLPQLVIENCASGGHRLEPSMIGRTAMSSFSDAHELPEIPLIAGNLLRVMLARQMQIWAVLHPSDTDQRLVYSLAATFIGRMCLSGDVVGLDDRQWDTVRRAIALYQRASPIIRSGRSRRGGVRGPSMRHPTGWQSVTRHADDGRGLLVVLHTFSKGPGSVQIPLNGFWRIEESLSCGSISLLVEEGELRIDGLRDFEGVVVRLTPARTGKGESLSRPSRQ